MKKGLLHKQNLASSDFPCDEHPTSAAFDIADLNWTMVIRKGDRGVSFIDIDHIFVRRCDVPDKEIPIIIALGFGQSNLKLRFVCRPLLLCDTE